MDRYKNLEEALILIGDARDYQMKNWPSVVINGGGRTLEEWIILMDVYLTKLKEIYAKTPAFIGDGDVPNEDGLNRIEKYAAILANLAIWAVQSAKAVECKTPVELAAEDLLNFVIAKYNINSLDEFTCPMHRQLAEALGRFQNQEPEKEPSV